MNSKKRKSDESSQTPQQKNCLDLAKQLANSQAKNAISEFNSSNSSSNWNNFWSGFGNSLSPSGTVAAGAVGATGLAASKYGASVLSKTGGIIPSGYPGAIIGGAEAAGWLGVAVLVGQAGAGVGNMYFQNQINQSSVTILNSSISIIKHELSINMKKCNGGK